MINKDSLLSSNEILQNESKKEKGDRIDLGFALSAQNEEDVGTRQRDS